MSRFHPAPGAPLSAILAVWVATLAAAPGARAQEPGALETFVIELERAGSRFADLETAMAEGYRKLGPDFPGMGEHWINPSLVIAGELDPEHPPVIAYTRVGEGRRLLGFAYTRVLGPDDRPPDGPFPPEVWHDHTGGVDEESLLLSGPMSARGESDDFRLSMVHVWLGAENPAGLLAQNNWALPFVRAGLPSPPDPSSQAARALSLATDEGMAFYDQLLREGVGLRGAELDLARTAFEEASESSATFKERTGGPEAPREADLRALESIWLELWARLDRTLSSASLEAMAVLRP